MQVLSRDSVTVSVDAVVYYRVKNPIMATNNVEDFRLEQPQLPSQQPPNFFGWIHFISFSFSFILRFLSSYLKI